jgi:hypothetical protein
MAEQCNAYATPIRRTSLILEHDAADNKYTEVGRQHEQEIGRKKSTQYDIRINLQPDTTKSPNLNLPAQIHYILEELRKLDPTIQLELWALSSVKASLGDTHTFETMQDINHYIP